MKWNIVVPGQVPDWFATLEDGVVCVVNGAMRTAPRCDFWCCYDAPNDIHHTGFKRCRELRPAIVTEKKRDVAWRKGVKKWPRWQQPSIHSIEWGPVWLAAALKGPRYSTFLAVMWAIQRGATVIHLHGCTMEGSGYGDAELDQLTRVSNKKTSHWEMRWKKERIQFANAKKACAERGIEFENVTPRSAVPEKP